MSGLDLDRVLSSERKPIIVGGVTELISFPKGLTSKQIEFSFDPSFITTGNPESESQSPYQEQLMAAWQRTQEIRGSQGDFNGPKVTLSSIGLERGVLQVTIGLTDYFTLWGLPGASPELHAQAKEELLTKGSTDIPLGISNHPTVLVQNPSDNDDVKLLARLSSRGGGFSAGRVALTFEEQQEPTDLGIHAAIHRGLREEIGEAGASVQPDNIKVLSFGLENAAAYIAVSSVTAVTATEDEVRQSIQKAPDHKETSAFFLIPVADLDRIAETQNIAEILKPYDTQGVLPPDAALQLHPTVLWRISCLQKFIASFKLNS